MNVIPAVFLALCLAPDAIQQSSCTGELPDAHSPLVGRVSGSELIEGALRHQRFDKVPHPKSFKPADLRKWVKHGRPKSISQPSDIILFSAMARAKKQLTVVNVSLANNGGKFTSKAPMVLPEGTTKGQIDFGTDTLVYEEESGFKLSRITYIITFRGAVDTVNDHPKPPSAKMLMEMTLSVKMADTKVVFCHTKRLTLRLDPKTSANICFPRWIDRELKTLHFKEISPPNSFQAQGLETWVQKGIPTALSNSDDLILFLTLTRLKQNISELKITAHTNGRRTFNEEDLLRAEPAGPTSGILDFGKELPVAAFGKTFKLGKIHYRVSFNAAMFEIDNDAKPARANILASMKIEIKMRDSTWQYESATPSRLECGRKLDSR